MSRPHTSIIMPTFNRAYMIRCAIDSVVAQTDPGWELIIVDDGSTDNTEPIVASYEDDRIRYFKQKNRGPAAGRNSGLAHAKGKWIAYLDSDNELLPHYLETMHRWLGKNQHAMYSIPRANRTLELYENGKLVKTIDDSDDTPPGIVLEDIYLRKLHFDTNGFMHLKRLFEEGITWDEALISMEDWDIVMTMGERHPDSFLYVEAVLYNYYQRYSGDGIVSNMGYGKWAEVFEQIYQKHKDDKLMKNQTWYPDRVNKWRRLQREYDAGKLPPYQRYYF